MTFHTEQWIALLPILAVAGTAVVVMLAIAIRRNHWWNATLAVAGLNAALFWVAIVFYFYGGAQVVTPLLIVDGYALFYMALILVLTNATATLSHAYLEGLPGHKEEHYVLLVIAALGALVLACSNHFASFFLGIELLSLPLYGMAAYVYKDARSLEAGVKYLILSAAASGFLLFGMALVYSQLGTLGFGEMAQRLADSEGLANPYLLAGGALMLCGVGFKLSVVPFHLWTPDVYEGAPAPVGAFLATVSKTAVFVVLLRWFVQGGAAKFAPLLDALSAIAIASILVGNVLALMQSNIKRLLAYSSIAHFGYLLVALIASGEFAVEAVGVYLVTYAITVMGAFGVVALMSSPRGERDADTLPDYRGLFWKRPNLTAIMTAMMLSLAGIPVTAGFIGKFYVLAVGIDQRLWWLVGAVVLGSAIGLYYYLRVVVTMFLQDPARRRFAAPDNWAYNVGGVMLVLVTAFMFVLGLYPEPVIALIRLSGLPLR
ncbi:MAG TPA: NADH-quinone oxidoreductase subunit NuoN [Candidatus Binatia bacterium]|nr:NADH-quinone oxidoreductase subunit NuoN [Candidatus Binatia bacterium]